MKKNLPYKTLLEDLRNYVPAMRKAAEIIEDEGVSNYPIFVIYDQSVDIGINIVAKNIVHGKWSVNASTLEEFVGKQLVASEKVDDFRTLYKTHPGDLCLFVLRDSGADFVFMPG